MPKLQPIYDLQKEINRLFIAGSKFAKEDPRLLKYVPVFEKLGEKVPVFAKLANDIKDLAQSSTADSSIKLMNISTLLYSVLYTQGETFLEDWTLSPNEPLLNWEDLHTQFSYLEIKPVIDALSIARPGRVEVLVDAFERNVFNDFKTFEYLDNALQDKNHEVVQYVAETIIPSVGKIIAPYLKKNFKLEDNSVNARRLKLLIHFDEDLTETVDQIIGGKYPKLQVEAIIYLAKDPKNEPLIHKLTKDKNKSVRESALKACALLGTETSLELLKNAFINLEKKTTAVLIPIVQAIALVPMKEQEQELLDYLFERLKLTQNETDLKNCIKLYDEFSEEISILDNKSFPIFETFFASIIQNNDFKSIFKKEKKWFAQRFTANALDEQSLHTSVNYAYRELAYIICKQQTAERQKIYETYFDHLTDEMKIDYFYDVKDFGYSKEKIFDTFNSIYPNVISDQDLLKHCNGTDSSSFTIPDTSLLDTRWYPLIQKKLNTESSDEKIYLMHSILPKNDIDFNGIIMNKFKIRFSVNYIQCILERDVDMKAYPLENPEYIGFYSKKDKYDYILTCISQYAAYNSRPIYVEDKSFYKTFPVEYATKMREVVAYRTNKKMYYTYDFLLDIAAELEQVKNSELLSETKFK